METTVSRPLTGRRVLLYLLAFFGIVFGANFTMMTLAIETLPGTEVDSPYQEGLAYNGEIAAAAAQNARAWAVAAHVERTPDGRADVRIEPRDATGAPVAGLTVTAYLSRPIDKRADRPLTVTERGIGVYRGEASDVSPGQWDLVFEAFRGSDRVYLSRNRVVLP
ncbi:FixH family protein [Rhodovulum sp. PH10]|uniref:FixH family protein n=1 Tax=Rhodovulum sp. PH10 TaxID=1187851 RepID=UPI00058FE15D|nr:FixH family protein [Rhodovulum sp. PH10]